MNLNAMSNKISFVIKQEMLHILTMAVREIIHACICNLKEANIDVQLDQLSNKE